MSELYFWNECKKTLEKDLSIEEYSTWIAPLLLEENSGSNPLSYTVLAPNKFISDWVEQNYGLSIEERLSAITSNSDLNLAFEVTATNPVISINETPQQNKQTNIEKGYKTIKSNLIESFNFGTFVEGKSNQIALAASRQIASGLKNSYNPLFIYGGVGLGKTHLMHAIAWELQSNRPDINVMYLSAEQFMYRFVQALRERKMMDFKELFRSVDVLMVDDVQFIAGKDSTQEEFFHTFNALVDQNKQIIISADRAPGEIKNLEDRIASRLQCGLVVDLHPTTYELRLGILQSKIELYQSSYPGIEVRQEVVEFLAHRISSNVRVLEGALTRLFAFASLVGREITVELTQDCLSDILRASDRKITVEEIQRKVSEHYNIRLSDMLGPKRLRSFARPRQIAMYLCKKLTSRSLPEIGRRFGGRDHTTVMHGVRRIEDLRNQDSQMSDDLDMLRRSLEG